jgi:hypothetical protein
MRLLLAWLVMLVVSVLNGIARDAGYGQGLDPLRAHQLSTLYGMTLLGVVIGVYAWRYPFRSAASAWRTGVFWLALTVVFEFLFFHYVTGHAWEELLDNYNLAAGRLWPVLLLWIAVAPVVFCLLWRHRRGATSPRCPSGDE